MEQQKEKSPLLKIIELLEQNGYRVFKAEEIFSAPNPREQLNFRWLLNHLFDARQYDKSQKEVHIPLFFERRLSLEH